MALPERPRLGPHVRARRQIVDGRARVLLHLPDRPPVHLGDREWTVLRQADGSRDLEGICIAAERAGAPVRVSHARAFFEELARLGFFETEEDTDASEPAFARDLPIQHLPGYLFACDGSGGCCRQFDTILFSPLEVAQARVLAPSREDAAFHPERAFLPEQGGASILRVVTRREGACLYLDEDGRCSIHAGKPAGCRTFPARFIDVGDAIRVLPRFECACVFAHRPGGEPLTRAQRGRELPPELFVSSLPASISLGERRVSPRELLEWLDRRASALADEPDLAAFAWSLAAELDGNRSAPSFAPARASIERLLRIHTSWRSHTDLVRRAAEWTAEALGHLDDGASPPAATQPADEELYLRAAFFGATVGIDGSVQDGLRERALAMWIARAFSDETRAHADAAHPLALVEALIRGHGLDLMGR